MASHRCTLCFQEFEPELDSDYARFEYVETAGHEERYPSDLYFCSGCSSSVRELTEEWEELTGAGGGGCSFCGRDVDDGTRFAVEGSVGGESSVRYDLCSECDGAFEQFLRGERSDILTVPERWTVYGQTSRHLFGVGTESNRIYVDPTAKNMVSGMGSMSAGVPEKDANCYSVTLVKNLGTAGERPSEIASFEQADDAIEFARLVSLYAASSPSPTEFVESDFRPEPMEDRWQPDPIISDVGPREAAEKMLGYKASHLEEALEKHAQ